MRQLWRDCARDVKAGSAAEYIRQVAGCVAYAQGTGVWEMQVVGGDREQPTVRVRVEGVGSVLLVCSTSEKVCYPVLCEEEG